MKTLWIFQTNKQEYLDDCKKYQVYGVSDPSELNIDHVAEGDSILIRLKFKNKEDFGYLGPFVATSTIGDWALSILGRKGIWNKVKADPSHSPRWITTFPWCIFLAPGDNYICDLRTLSSSHPLPACYAIAGSRADEIISNLIQDEFLPDSRIGSYRTLRGVWVRSRAEYMIDNWFAERGVVTYYERAIYLNSIRIVPDWYIPSLNTYVEFLGLRGDHKYDKMWSEKEAAYKSNQIKYVTLIDRDLNDLDRNIPNKLPTLKAIGIK
jgi:hypothetical protein